MLCAVYKTRKKDGMYLYVPKKDHFEDVPEPLMAKFGRPELVTIIALEKPRNLAWLTSKSLSTSLMKKAFTFKCRQKKIIC